MPGGMLNREEPTNYDDSGEDKKNNEGIKRSRALIVGKKVLGAINYPNSHKKEINAVYNIMKEDGYKFGSGESPAARRVEALLVAIEGRTGAENLKLGRRYMQKSIGELTDGVSNLVAEELRSQLEDWSDYFGDESCELPEWFKMWAWQGMTKLGGYDTVKKRYKKRSKETIYTFPSLDKEALDETYELLENYYGGEAIDSERIEGLDENSIKSCNFNELYSYFVNKHIVPTPEYGEPIRGGWRGYKPGDENKVALAANGTGWCVVSSSKAGNYLERPGSSFNFFHLENPATGELDSHACASVRMEDGKVVEISGRKAGFGQMLEDALVETVEKEVLSMPGGEKYRQAFKDRKELIRLSRKKEKLTKEELEFVYEIHRKIEKLELHSALEEHTVELRAKYDVETVINMGVDRDALIDSIMRGDNDVHVNEENILRHLDGLLRIGVDHDRILDAISPLSAYNNFDRLTRGRVSKNDIVRRMGSGLTGARLEGLFERKVDSGVILEVMRRPDIKEHVGILLDYGISPEVLMKKMWGEDILRNKGVFDAHGVEIDYEKVLGRMSAVEKMRGYDDIKRSGIKYDIYQAVKEIDKNMIWDSEYQRDVREFLFRKDVDPIKFADSVSPENMPYLQYFIVSRMENDLEELSRRARSTKDEESMKRIEELNAKIKELGGNSGR